MKFKIILSIIGAIIILSCKNETKQLNPCVISHIEHMLQIEHDTCSGSIIITDSLNRIFKKGYWNDSTHFTGVVYLYYGNSFFPKYEFSMFNNIKSGYHKHYFEKDSGRIQKEWLEVKSFGVDYIDKQILYNINGNEIGRQHSVLVNILDSNIFLGDTFRVKITPKRTKNYPNNEIHINNTRWLFEDKNTKINIIPSQQQSDSSYIIKQIATKPGLNYISGSVFNYYTLEKKEGKFGYSYFFLEEYTVKER